MKLNGILNSTISKALSDLGHTDKIAIGDCGLPIEESKKSISAFDWASLPSRQYWKKS